MNENDKILITAYFDNEVSIDERKYVELLLSEDVDAIEYSNAIKLSNNQIDNFFSSYVPIIFFFVVKICVI